MEKKDHLYSGKAKTLYKTDNPDLLVLHFRDDTSAFDGVKTAQLKNKGKVNNHFNAFIMKKLTEAGIKNHFVSLIDERESIVKNLEMIPVECVVRNISAGNLAKRLGIAEGLELKPTIFEMYYKSDALHDPMINEYHVETFGWANAQEISIMRAQSFKVNEILCDLFSKTGLLLVDFKLEFGRFHGEIILGDEFTPDGCRIWDAETFEKFDKDRFRRDLGNVIESYQMVAERLGIII